MVVDARVLFGSPISGTWIPIKKDEVCIYTDKKGTSVVVGNYKDVNTHPIMTKGLVVNKTGEVLLQQTEDGKDYTFTKLNPQLVALKIQEFLSSLINCQVV